MTKIVIDIPDEDYKFIKDLQFYNSGRRSGKTIERNVINAIKNGKSYEERPAGHWVNGYKSFNCSVCGKIAYSWNHFGEYIQVKSNFCPHCGADMRGDKE